MTENQQPIRKYYGLAHNLYHQSGARQVFYSKSYSSFGGNKCCLVDGDWRWSKTPARWRTAEGAAKALEKSAWLQRQGFKVAPLPFTKAEQRSLLEAAAPKLLKVCKALLQPGCLTEPQRQLVLEAVAEAEGETGDKELTSGGVSK